MKTFFENRPERKFLLLVGTVLFIGAFLTYESMHYLRLQKQIAAINNAIIEANEKEGVLLQKRETTAEHLELLAQYETRVPIADNGYVWVSRVVREAVPNLALKITPPQFDEQQLRLSPDYCCGTFDVRGTSRLDELLQILQKVESDLPFARVQDLHFSITEDRVTFSFTLMALMKLNQDIES